jgi:hypothetical protein
MFYKLIDGVRRLTKAVEREEELKNTGAVTMNLTMEGRFEEQKSEKKAIVNAGNRGLTVGEYDQLTDTWRT